MRDKCLVITCGTEDIYKPLYRCLAGVLANPVFLIEIRDENRLLTELMELSRRYQVWVLPSNELDLNTVSTIVANNVSILREKVKIPGTASLGREYDADDLSNKEVVFSLLKLYKGIRFSQPISRVDTLANLNAEAHITFPVVVKPCVKSRDDSFTQLFPSKMLVVDSEAALDDFVRSHPFSMKETRFLIQEVLSGVALSWIGYVDNGNYYGYRINSLVKSPEGGYGGTTTLASLSASDTNLDMAVGELVKFMRLDGIFEIEFILRNNALCFYYEINPRPILQTSLLLSQKQNIFSQYLSRKGFIVSSRINLGLPTKFWGSAVRYLNLNAGRKKSLIVLAKIIISDVRYGRYFSFSEKIDYTKLIFRLLRQALLRKLSILNFRCKKN